MNPQRENAMLCQPETLNPERRFCHSGFSELFFSKHMCVQFVIYQLPWERQDHVWCIGVFVESLKKEDLPHDGEPILCCQRGWIS